MKALTFLPLHRICDWQMQTLAHHLIDNKQLDDNVLYVRMLHNKPPLLINIPKCGVCLHSALPIQNRVSAENCNLLIILLFA